MGLDSAARPQRSGARCPSRGPDVCSLRRAELGEVLGLADDLLEVGEDKVLGVALQLGRTACRLCILVEVDAVVASDALADVVAAAATELLHTPALGGASPPTPSRSYSQKACLARHAARPTLRAPRPPEIDPG